MATFRRKPEVVDARQLTGDTQNDLDVQLWVNSIVPAGVQTQFSTYGVRAKDGTRGIITRKLFLIRMPDGSEIAHMGDWIVHRQDGHLEIVRPENMELDYEEV